MMINMKIIACLFFLIASINSSAAILDKEAADKADLNLLQNETVVFQSIRMGIALSLAQCDGVELCSLTVEENEIKELINTLDDRIDNLVLKQEEAEDPVAFDKILSAYIDERESYTGHLEKLKGIKSSLDEDGDLLDETLESEATDFPVESARNEELLDYLNQIQELEAFEDDELEDDEDLDDLPDLPELEDINETP
ncbi:MAG: hypothetical protein HND53_00950 [Proteobacteria bacterium]|nr:hypothetical protein [Pseudomonadota bacterium]NOG59041.1 hypothetical protein [Pseudomonadota bacterium]